jgi:uncharacterized membrane protein
MTDETNSSDVVSVPHEQGVHVERSTTVYQPVGEVYAFWRDPSRLAETISAIRAAEKVGENRIHFQLDLPIGMESDFDAEVYTDEPNEVVSWRSLDGSPVQAAAAVRFRPAPADRGTEVKLTLEFVPPAGPLGKALLTLFGEAPNKFVDEILRESKAMLEAGELPTTKGQPSGRADDGSPA